MEHLVVVGKGGVGRSTTAAEMREAADFFFEIFDGGHEIRYQAAFDWFDRLSAHDNGQEMRLTG